MPCNSAGPQFFGSPPISPKMHGKIKRPVQPIPTQNCSNNTPGTLKTHLEMRRLPLEQPPSTHLPNKLTIPRGHLPPHRHHVRTSFNRHPFEGIVVHVHTLCFA